MWVPGIFKPACVVVFVCPMFTEYQISAWSTQPCAFDAPQIDTLAPGILHIVAIDPIRTEGRLDSEKY